MGGVFMCNSLKRLVIYCIFVAIVWCIGLISEKHQLQDSLIRFHVIANSDSVEDQTVKLKVRDAVLESIQQDLASLSDIASAKEYLSDNIPKIREVVNRTLSENGYPECASVSLCKERFDTRAYDTFSLPAGIYHSLRIILGNGTGKNWWCVTFPSLCIPATSSEFRETAVNAGFSQRTVKTLAGNGPYKIRFYLMDRLGELENLFFTE